jgi:hypothetical protein
MVNNAWQPLGFLTKSLTTTQRKYSAYDRELLAMYTAVKRFRHAAEGRNFVIFTDHKSLTYAFDQKLDKRSPRQFRYLDYTGQFTTDVRYVKGLDNSVIPHQSDRKIHRSPDTRRRTRKRYRTTQYNQIRYNFVMFKKDTFFREQRSVILRHFWRQRTTLRTEIFATQRI